MTRTAQQIHSLNDPAIKEMFEVLPLHLAEIFYVELITYYYLDNHYNPDMVVNGQSLTNATQIRIHCDASGNGDRVYIDEVVISGK